MAKAEFDKLWARWRKTSEREDAINAVLRQKYRWTDAYWSFLNKTERTRLESARAAESVAMDRCFAWLDVNSPRYGWRTFPPCWWVMDKLSYEDAISTGPVTAPPPAYGGTARDMERFALPLQVKAS